MLLKEIYSISFKAISVLIAFPVFQTLVIYMPRYSSHGLFNTFHPLELSHSSVHMHSIFDHFLHSSTDFRVMIVHLHISLHFLFYSLNACSKCILIRVIHSIHALLALKPCEILLLTFTSAMLFSCSALTHGVVFVCIELIFVISKA